MRIGIDFDNTIAGFDEAFNSIARKWGLVDQSFSGNKKQVRDAIRALPDGETHWMKLQGQIYGRYMPKAVPMPGVLDFLDTMLLEGFEVLVVSHKTENGHFDPDQVNLHEAALNWMKKNGILERIQLENIFFELTREAKLARIASLGLVAFVDDLEEVFREPGFPPDVQGYLYHPGAGAPDGPFDAYSDFASIVKKIVEGHSLKSIAANLLCQPVVSIAVAERSGNNRVYRIETVDRTFALKRYPKINGDDRDRLGSESMAFTFLAQNGVSNVPITIAKDSSVNAAVYQWIDGVSVKEPSYHDIEAAIQFVKRLNHVSRFEEAKDLSLASEACLSASDLVHQVEARLRRLNEVKSDHSGLCSFLDRCGETLVQIEKEVQMVLGESFNQELAQNLRTLSPSDFGFHNALRRVDGSLAFLDMEYFGWDDPVKLACDFVLHPGMSLLFLVARDSMH